MLLKLALKIELFIQTLRGWDAGFLKGWLSSPFLSLFITRDRGKFGDTDGKSPKGWLIWKPGGTGKLRNLVKRG